MDMGKTNQQLMSFKNQNINYETMIRISECVELNKKIEKIYNPISLEQKRMYMLHQIDKKSIAYNIAGVIEIEGELKLKKIEEILKKITCRHKELRTSFQQKNENILQKIHNINEITFDVEIVELNRYSKVDDVINKFIKPFNLSKAPLVKVGIVKKEKNKNIVVIDMHQIISSGVSIQTLTKEFAEFYVENEKKEYREYASKKNKFIETEFLKKQEVYLNQLKEKTLKFYKNSYCIVENSLELMHNMKVSLAYYRERQKCKNI